MSETEPGPCFRGKVAVVTGASRGIGREIAGALHAGGALVALLARPSEALTASAAELGDRAVSISGDLSNPDSIREAFGEIADRFGAIDILVNNAAICRPYPVAASREEDIAADIATNLLGPILCTRAALPLLVDSAGADIVNVSSESVRYPVPHMTVYAASKGGFETFSSGLRAELRPLGIRVTTLRLGNIEGTTISRGWDEHRAAEFRAAMQETGAAVQVGRGGSVRSVARAVVSILSLPRDVNVDLMELRSI